MNQNRWTRFDVFSRFLSSIAFLIFLWIVIAIFVIFNNLFVGINFCIGLAIVFALHFLISEGIFKHGGRLFSFQRKRPYVEYLGEIVPVGKKFSDSSFPSSHVSAMSGGLVVLTYFYEFVWPISIIIIVAMCWSRVRNGMHYPSDILAGMLLGLIYGCLALKFLNVI